MSKVIHVGIIGLSADTSSGTSWAARAHLPYLLKSPNYKIVALQNSSTEKARKAIEHYNLPSSVKAYGTPEDLAKDPDVNLVVSCVRVDSHSSSIIPSIRAGKDVYVEWPLEANLAKATEIFDLAQKHQVRNIIGLQSRFTPIIQKIKQIVQSGRIGRVISSTNVTNDPNSGSFGRKHIAYFADREVGGNMLTIYFGHAIEYMTEVLGPIKSLSSSLSIQHPVIDIIDRDGSVVEKGRQRTSPDQVLLSGTMESGAIISYHIRGGPTFPGLPALDWRIQGSTGEIRITSDTFHIFVHPGNMKIEVANYESGVVEGIKVEEDKFMDLPAPATNIGRLYDAFWEEKFGKATSREYRDFEYAVKWHKAIDDMYLRFDAEHI